MKLLQRQLSKRKLTLLIFILLSTFIFVFINSFAVVILYTFVNVLAKYAGDGQSVSQITIWDQLLAPIYDSGHLSITQSLGILAGMTIGLSLIAFLIRILCRSYIIKLIMEMMYNLRNQVYAYVLYLDEDSFNQISPTSIVNRLNNDIYMLHDAAINYYLYFYESLWYIILNIIFSLTLSPILSTIYLALLPLAFFIIFFAQKQADKYYNQNLVSLDKTNQVVRENILGVRIVKSFNLQTHQYKRFIVNNDQWLKTVVYSELIMMFSIIFLFVILNISVIAILLFGGFLSKEHLFGGISVGVIVAFMNYVFLCISNVYGLATSLAGLIRVKPVVRRINELLALKNENMQAGKVLDNFVANISFKNVNFSYSHDLNALQLKNINLEIKAKQSIGIIGPTGSGKSTLVQLIARLYKPVSGSITISDTNIEDLNLFDLRNQIGFAPQEKLIFSGTIKSNLLHGKPDASWDEMVVAAKNACAYEFIDKKEQKFDSPINQNGSNLSGGQAQRLSLARTLIKKPKILILDDTLSALDNLTRDTVLANLKQHYADSTQIIVSQQIKTICHADQILVMDKGQIIASGKHEQLLKECELYQQINQSQQTIGEA